MSYLLSPRKANSGWVMEVPAEMANTLKVAPGSFVLLYPKEGVLETEILPAPDDELLDDYEIIFKKYRETFEELKRLGD